jgi:hypothetical protein
LEGRRGASGLPPYIAFVCGDSDRPGADGRAAGLLHDAATVEGQDFERQADETEIAFFERVAALARARGHPGLVPILMIRKGQTSDAEA